MILIDNDNPLESIYYIAYKFLTVIKEKKLKTLDIEKSFDTLNNELENKIDFGKYLLIIDYLFVNDFVKISSKGELETNVFK
ncbi:hypothetical protein Q6A83_04135 [Aliarcobacter skirrowii]|uniref:ABC-three component system middle component 6 n=1 Tax=Aliarcobacter skirrowii TaxID=28200 RepID=UPI0029B35AC1|nr:ABC-three component system middle component 6 [Aliarcobacter skirrowii]MDX4049962.1 hypothetical protein [Aliarcobacter skirrowii]